MANKQLGNMPTSFDIAIAVVLQNEGGYVNNPADPGGETNFGISKRAYPNLDIKHLTMDAAKEIYRHDYWVFQDLNSQAIATKCLDLAVNLGLHGGIKLVQESLLTLGQDVQPDGIWGPKTESTLNGSLDSEVLPEIRTEQSHHYVEWVAQNPARYPELKGLLRRVQSC